eukprot:SAG11_NODE_2558_length_3220_cov_11.157001_1_plen_115_part_10
MRAEAGEAGADADQVVVVVEEEEEEEEDAEVFGLNRVLCSTAVCCLCGARAARVGVQGAGRPARSNGRRAGRPALPREGGRSGALRARHPAERTGRGAADGHVEEYDGVGHCCGW